MSKVVIIGSGLGGLSCGAILAKNGYGVLVLEQGAQFGGCLQCFYRDGVKFETGMHYVGSAAKGQMLNQLMRYLEFSDLPLSELSPTGYDVVSLGGNRYKFAKGREAFINQMAEYFPHQRENLKRYYDVVESAAEASSVHSFRYADITINPEYQLRPINNVLEEVVSDPVLANVLVGNLPLYAAERDKTPFSTHAFIMNFFNKGSYRFVGGSDSVAKSLLKTIIKYGGEAKNNSKVERIICDGHCAKGVLLSSGELIPCDFVISDAHPMRTLEMLDTNLIRPSFRQRIRAIPQTSGVFSIYLKFKENSMPYMNHNFFGYSGDSPWDCEKYDLKSWPKGYLYMHFCHEPKPVHAKAGIILSYMNIDDLKQWADTSIGNRGEGYEEFKRRKAEKLLDLVQVDFPHIRECVESLYTSTPLTYRDYTGAEAGGLYGIAKDVNNPANRVSHRTRIPNVFQTGQNINSHGMLGVLVGSIVTCGEFISTKKIYEQIIEANK